MVHLVAERLLLCTFWAEFGELVSCETIAISAGDRSWPSFLPQFVAGVPLKCFSDYTDHISVANDLPEGTNDTDNCVC